MSGIRLQGRKKRASSRTVKKQGKRIGKRRRSTRIQKQKGGTGLGLTRDEPRVAEGKRPKRRQRGKENKKKNKKVTGIGSEPKKEKEKENSKSKRGRYSLRAKTRGLKLNNEATMKEFRERIGIDEEAEEADNEFWKTRSLKKRRGLWKDPDWKTTKKRSRRKKTQIPVDEIESDLDEMELLKIYNGEPCSYDRVLLDRIPYFMKDLKRMKKDILTKTKSLSRFFFYQNDPKARKCQSQIGEDSVPVCTDVRKFNFPRFMNKMIGLTGRSFDVIMMDPPWKLSTKEPSRGVAIAYDSLSDQDIVSLPLHMVQDEGFLFLWVINARYSKAFGMMEAWGYDVVDEVVWVKKTVTGKMAKGHGFYLQHAKETCLVGFKGDLGKFMKKFGTSMKRPAMSCPEKGQEGFDIRKFTGNTVFGDVIFSKRRGQSQKPNEIYELIEDLVPNGFYLEIFGRRNNLRNKWLTIGNEL